MAPKKSLENFIQSVEADGTQKESLAFTLDRERAAAKLGESQLPDPALWIVKMLQAAVAGGATNFEVIFSKRRVEISFDWALEHQAKGLLDLVVSGTLPKDPTLLHLITGIRTSFARAGSRFLLQTTGPEGRDIATLSQSDSGHYSDIEETSEARSLTFVIHRPHRTLTLSNSLNKPVIGLLKGSADEHLTLLERCWCSPIPISIDGRLIDARYDSSLSTWTKPSFLSTKIRKSKQTTPRCTIFHRYTKPGPGRPTLRVSPADGGSKDGRVLVTDQGEVRVSKFVHYGERFLDWIPQQEEGECVLTLACGAGHGNHIFFVLDGALVAKVAFSLEKIKKGLFGLAPPPGLTCGYYCFQPVELGDTDLSQFKLSDLERRRDEILRKICPTLVHSTKHALERISDLWYLPVSPSKVKLAKGVTGAWALAAATLGGVGMIPPSFIAGFFGFAAFMEMGGHRRQIELALGKNLKALQDFDPAIVEQPPIESIVKS